MVSTDKSNAKRSKFSKYLNKAVDIGVTGGIAAIPVAAPIAKGAGKITGELVEKLISEHEKSKQHKDGKLIEHLLKTFQPEDREWIMFLLDSFSTIFIWLVPFDYLINGVTSSKYFASQKHFRTVRYLSFRDCRGPLFHKPVPGWEPFLEALYFEVTQQQLLEESIIISYLNFQL